MGSFNGVWQAGWNICLHCVGPTIENVIGKEFNSKMKSLGFPIMKLNRFIFVDIVFKITFHISNILKLQEDSTLKIIYVVEAVFVVQLRH